MQLPLLHLPLGFAPTPCCSTECCPSSRHPIVSMLGLTHPKHFFANHRWERVPLADLLHNNGPLIWVVPAKPPQNGPNVRLGAALHPNHPALPRAHPPLLLLLLLYDRAIVVTHCKVTKT